MVSTYSTVKYGIQSRSRNTLVALLVLNHHTLYEYLLVTFSSSDWHVNAPDRQPPPINYRTPDSPHHLIQRLGQRSSGFIYHQIAPGVEACDCVVSKLLYIHPRGIIELS